MMTLKELKQRVAVEKAAAKAMASKEAKTTVAAKAVAKKLRRLAEIAQNIGREIKKASAELKEAKDLLAEAKGLSVEVEIKKFVSTKKSEIDRLNVELELVGREVYNLAAEKDPNVRIRRNGSNFVVAVSNKEFARFTSDGLKDAMAMASRGKSLNVPKGTIEKLAKKYRASKKQQQLSEQREKKFESLCKEYVALHRKVSAGDKTALKDFHRVFGILKSMLKKGDFKVNIDDANVVSFLKAVYGRDWRKIQK